MIVMSLFIYDWEVVSPVGIGKELFTQAVNEKLAQGDDFSSDGSCTGSVVFEDFDKKAYLGKKGVRGMDNLGAYATVASHLMVGNRAAFTDDERARVGVVLGTGTGSVKSQLEFIQDLHVQEQVEWVNPIQFPQTVMNCAAGQVSIWHHFTGVNTTVSGGYHSGVTALEYASNALRQSRVDQVFVGCAEEHSPYAKYLFPVDDRALRGTQHLGEGCAMFLAGERCLNNNDAELFGFRRFAYFKRHSREKQIDDLSRAIGNVLQDRDGRESGLRRICFNRFSHAEEAVIEGVKQRLPEAKRAASWCSNTVVADCLSASTGFQLGLLMAANGFSEEADSLDLAVTFDPSGGVAVSFLKHGAEV